MPLKQPYDFGQVYSKTGAGGLGTVATFSSVITADRAAKVRGEVVATLIGGSTAGNLTIIAQASRDGTNFYAIPITDDTAGTSGASGSVTTSAGATVRKSFSWDPSLYKGGVRLSIATAGAPNAGDLVTVQAEAQ